MKRQNGLALIEVVAAIAILGSAATAMLVAQARSMHQLTLARHQREAAGLAEQWVNEWRLHTDRTKVGSTGDFPDSPGWSWYQRVEPVRIERAELQRIELIVRRRDESGIARDVMTVEWLEPIPRLKANG